MSTAQDPPVATALSRALDALHEALELLAASTTRDQVWRVPGTNLLDGAAEVHRSINRADAVLHALVREIDVRGVAVEGGAPHTAGWLRSRLRLHPGAAKRMVTAARALHDDAAAGVLVVHADDADFSAAAGDPDFSPDATDPSAGGEGMGAVRAAFAAGSISGEHVGVICRTSAALSEDMASAVVDEAVTFLAEQAGLHDPKGLGHLATHLRHVLDQDGETDLERDEALASARRTFEIRGLPDGGSDVRGRFDAELSALLRAQLGPLAAPRPADDGGRDLRTTGQRNADALAEILRLAADSGGVPSQHGSRPTVSVHISLDSLMRLPGHPAGFLDWSGPISASAARRLACDARVIPVVLGAAGEPLDVGRSSYSVTQAIWRALVARDGGCAFAGCDRPPEWTEAHHRVHWADGGLTSVENCCLLCDHHHRQVHHHGWEPVLIGALVHVVPPPWVDPSGTPRPNTNPGRLAALRRLPRIPRSGGGAGGGSGGDGGSGGGSSGGSRGSGGPD